MDLIEDIGPILGIAAFLGFAILALLIVLQAREVRRLREWAGRAPERALEADDASQAVLDARGEPTQEPTTPGLAERVRARLSSAFTQSRDAIDRQSPVSPGIAVAALLLAAVIAAGIVTGGFGLTDDDEPAPEQTATSGGNGDTTASAGGAEPGEPVKVAILNATQVDDPLAPVSGVPGLADVVADELVEPAGYEVGVRTNAPSGEETTIIMHEPDAESDATELQSAVEPDLGEVELVPITAEVSDLVRGAPVVLLIGSDDSQFGQGAEAGAP